MTSRHTTGGMLSIGRPRWALTAMQPIPIFQDVLTLHHIFKENLSSVQRRQSIWGLECDPWMAKMYAGRILRWNTQTIEWCDLKKYGFRAKKNFRQRGALKKYFEKPTDKKRWIRDYCLQ